MPGDICAEDTTAIGQYFIHFCHRNDQNKGLCCPIPCSFNGPWKMHCGSGNRTSLYRHFPGVISLPQGIQGSETSEARDSAFMFCDSVAYSVLNSSGQFFNSSKFSATMNTAA